MSAIAVRLESSLFAQLLNDLKTGTVIVTAQGRFTKKYRFLIHHNGLPLYTWVREPISIPPNSKIIVAENIHSIC